MLTQTCYSYVERNEKTVTKPSVCVGTLQSVFSLLAASAAAAASLQSYHGEIESGDGERRMKGERGGCMQEKFRGYFRG